MSRFAHFNPDDPEGAMDRLIDRADHDRKAARENMTRVQPGWYAEWLLMKYGREIIVLPRPERFDGSEPISEFIARWGCDDADLGDDPLGDWHGRNK